MGDVERKGGLKKTAPGAENAKPVFQIPVGLPCLVSGRHVKKTYDHPLTSLRTDGGNKNKNNNNSGNPWTSRPTSV